MKISKKRTVQVMVFAIALLLVLALSIGITGAWYQAKRQASGTVIMDQGIIIDYKGFAEDAAATTWGKGVNLKLFTITDDAALPGQQIPVNSGDVSSIRANVDSVDFYARVKLEYKFYNDDAEVTTLANPSDLITTSENFFGDNWVKSQNDDGWFYYGADTALGKLTPSAEESAFVALFADGAKFIIEGANFVGADEGQGGGFVVNETTSINKIIVTLTLETLQGSADSEDEKWSIARLPVIEDFNSTSNKLTDTSGNVLTPSETTLAESTTYQVVDAANAGYKFTITNSATGQAQTMGFDVSVVNGEATITGYTGTPTELTIPDYITVNGKNYKVTSIGNNAFYKCSSLTSITIPDSVTIVGHYTFYNSGLISVTIPDSITSLGFQSFCYCSNLSTLTIGKGIVQTGEFVFTDCPNLKSINFLGNVTDLGSGLFQNCISLELINLPDTVNNIESSVFAGCSSLTSIAIPNGVTQIKYDTFKGCTKLSTICLPNYLNNIGWGAFQDCKSLTTFTIPNGVKTIEYDTFRGCNNLNSIIIPNSVTTIEQSAFNSSGLTSIIIPDSVTSIENYAFANCANLELITVNTGNGKYKSVGNCLIETASKTLILGCKTSEIPTDDSVTNIGGFAFSNHTGLTSITIPNNVTSIGSYAFSGCTGLTSITIPDSVTSIGGSAFSLCENLNSVIIGNRVTNIESNAFSDCSSLTSITIPNSVTSIGASAFSGCVGLTSITIPDGVTSIGVGAFSGCSGLTSITIPDSVTSIGFNAFSGCSDLTTTIGEGWVKTSDNSAVDASTLLKDISDDIKRAEA